MEYGGGSLPPKMASAWVRGALVLGLKPSDYRLNILPANIPDPEAEAREARGAWREHLVERVHGRPGLDRPVGVRRSLLSDSIDREEVE